MGEILQELGDAIRPEGVSLGELLVAGVIVAVMFPAARLVERLVRNAAIRIKGISAQAVDLLGYGSRYLTLLALAALVLNLVGVNVGLVVALAVLLLILIVLTLRPLVQNAAAGFLLRSRPSFAVGDEIGLSGQIGQVLSIGARTTALRTRDGRRVHIPNTDVLDEVIVVYTAFDARRLSIEISLDPRTDLDEVSGLLVETVSALPEVRSGPAPEVIAASLRRGTLDVSIDLWFEPSAHSERHVVDVAIRALHAALREAGIALSPPRVTVDDPDDAC